MKNEFGECFCAKLLSREKIYCHLTGCPVGDEDKYREYHRKLEIYKRKPWYIRLITWAPEHPNIFEF